MTNLIYSHMKPNEQKIFFQGITPVFWRVLVIINEILIFFLRIYNFTNFLESYGINSLTKSVIYSVMSSL